MRLGLPRARGAVREPADRAAIALAGRADVAVGGAAAALLMGGPLAARLLLPLGRPAVAVAMAVALTLTAAMAVALAAAVAVALGGASALTAAALTLCRALALALLLRTPRAVVRRLGPRGLRRQRRDALRQFRHRYLHARHLLDIPQVFPLLAVAERDRDPGRARPRRAADAVDVGFGDVRQVVVDDVRDAVDVDAAGRDVGRDEHPAMPRLEAGKRPLALRLALVAVDRRRRDAARRKRAHDLVGTVLGAGEDEDALDRRLAQHGVEERRLLRRRHEHDALLDPLGG